MKCHLNVQSLLSFSIWSSWALFSLNIQNHNIIHCDRTRVRRNSRWLLAFYQLTNDFSIILCDARQREWNMQKSDICWHKHNKNRFRTTIFQSMEIKSPLNKYIGGFRKIGRIFFPVSSDRNDANRRARIWPTDRQTDTQISTYTRHSINMWIINKEWHRLTFGLSWGLTYGHASISIFYHIVQWPAFMFLKWLI